MGFQYISGRSELCSCVKLLPVFAGWQAVRKSQLHFSQHRYECGHLLNIWETIECWIPLLFPGHLPVLGIVAVGSGLALIIFGISSFLIYRWVWLHPADASCLCCFQLKPYKRKDDTYFFFISFKKRKMFETGFMGQAAICARVVFTQLLPRQQLSRWWC